MYRQKELFEAWCIPADGSLDDAPAWVTAAMAAGTIEPANGAFIVKRRVNDLSSWEHAMFGDDWIIKRENGRIEECAADTFEKTYEEIA